MTSKPPQKTRTQNYLISRAHRRKHMKRKTLLLIPVVMLLLISSFLISTGFQKRTDVVLSGYTVSETGSEIKLHILIPTSMGYIRGRKDTGGGAKPHYLTFFSTFGGLNSSFGSTDTIVLNLNPSDTEIYFNRPDNTFELVLRKNPTTGEWERPGA